MLTAIWPIFALICLGFILARSRFPAGGFWAAAERINYFLLFPALLVASLAVAPVRDPALWRLGSAAAATLLAAAAVLWVYRRVRPMPAARFGPALQGCIRFNTYMALSLLAVLSGPPALQGAAIFLAIAVPLGNLLSILALGTMPEAHPIAPESHEFDLPIRRALYGKATRWRIYYAVIDGAVRVLHVRHGRRSDWQP